MQHSLECSKKNTHLPNPLCTPGVPGIKPSASGCLFAFSPLVGQHLRALSQPGPLTLKTPVFKPCWLQKKQTNKPNRTKTTHTHTHINKKTKTKNPTTTHKKLSLFFFFPSPIALGECSPCSFPCVFLSLKSFSATRAPSPLHHPGSICPPNHVSALLPSPL